jgi:hypothetical protein
MPDERPFVLGASERISISKLEEHKHSSNPPNPSTMLEAAQTFVAVAPNALPKKNGQKIHKHSSNFEILAIAKADDHAMEAWWENLAHDVVYEVHFLAEKRTQREGPRR